MGLVFSSIGPWLSLVERLVRDEEAAGSNPAGPTIFFLQTFLRWDENLGSTALREAHIESGEAQVAEPAKRDNPVLPTASVFAEE